MDIGIDLIEYNTRPKLEDNAPKRLLGTRELFFYNKLTNNKRKNEYLFSRLALKEAYIKAFNQKGLVFTTLEFINDESGKIICYYQNKLLSNIRISLSHTTNYCIAIVLKLV